MQEAEKAGLMKKVFPRHRMVRTVLVVLSGIVVAGLFLGWELLGRKTSEEYLFEVARGAPAVEVLRDLRARGIIDAEWPARIYLRLTGGEIRWGSYRIPGGISVADVLNMLVSGREESVDITIPEGMTVFEIGRSFRRAGIEMDVPWDEIVHRTRWIEDLAPSAGSLEGFLFPETYRVTRHTGAEALARHMVDMFREVWNEEGSLLPNDTRSVLEVVTLASMVEAETCVDSERAGIAGVYLNRLRRGMLLQCDPTVIYALRRRDSWNGFLSRRDLDVDDPYNTYRYPGLPPGPICNPGRASIRAAVGPEDHHELYFVAKPGGGHEFSKNLNEHNRAVARYRRWMKKH